MQYNEIDPSLSISCDPTDYYLNNTDISISSIQKSRDHPKSPSLNQTCGNSTENDSAFMEISAVLMVHECREIISDLQQKLNSNLKQISSSAEENKRLNEQALDLKDKIRYRQLFFNSIEPSCDCRIV